MADHSSSNDWRAKADLETMRQRALVYEKIREFFRQRNVLEVDTPLLSPGTTPDPNIHSFETEYVSMLDDIENAKRYLSTSPEFHMKRLLAAGSGSIYQLCHVFRQAESGSQHNPEFTMLEWYRVDFNYHALMNEVSELICFLFGKTIEMQVISYQQAFMDYLQVDPLAASPGELKKHAERFGLVADEQYQDKDLYLDFLMSHRIQPQLGNGKLTFIHEYPATQCAYARLAPDNPAVAQRFELFYQGVELANGYQELLDAREQLQRFEQQNQQRKMQGQAAVHWDTRLIDALKSGMPQCSGVALGVDRLLQIMLGLKNIADVLAFPFNRA